MSTEPFSIGYMQGRLCPMVDGKIQAFPWRDWRTEFPGAQRLGIGLMEWTLDHDRLSENPLMTPQGRAEIRDLSSKFGVRVGSLTGDIFMQAPFWKVSGQMREQRLAELDLVLDACAILGIRIVVVPLVDNGSMLGPEHEAAVIDTVSARAERLRRDQLVIAFECDYRPSDLARFIGCIPSDICGINLDIGNSAALGYDTAEEIAAYGERIVNVHIKDRILGGTTVPLGTGSADIPRSLRMLVSSGYRGSYVLQTARAQDGDNEGTLGRYLQLTRHWLRDAQS
ncbi:IolE Sugar phosphate isomerases/epimerases [Mycobacteriaceae bacterium]